MAETAVIAAIAAKTGASAATVVAVGAAATAAVASIAISSVQAKKAEADSRKDSARAPRDITVRSAIEPARIIYGEARTSGPVVYTNTASTPGTTDNSTLWTVISLCNHEVEDITDVWLDGDKILASQIVGGNVTSGKYGPIGSNYITNIYKRYGTSTQTHVTQLASAFTDWTDAYDGRGVAYIVTGFELGTATGEGVWAQGAPQNIRAVVKGKKVYDPRKDSTNGGSGTHRLADPTTWEWSDNPALCVADYLFDSRLGMGAEGITYDEIDWAMVTTAANVCDATVTSPAGNQKRFTCNGALSTGETYAENIKQLLSSMAGSLTWSGGKFRIRALAYEAPTYTFTGDDVIGDVQIQPETSRAQRFNLVRGTFIDPASDYVATEFIPVENTTFRDDRDGGQTLNKQIKLPFTNNEYMAQRIAYKQLNVADQQLRCVVPMNYKAMKVAVGDRIQLSIEELSWSNKPFLVEGWVFSPNGGYELTLQEESSSAYADPALGDYSTRTWAGDVVFPDPDVPAPSGLAATNEQEAVLLTWDAPSRPSAYDEVVVYASSSSAWSGASEIGRTRGTTFRHEIDIVPATYPTSATYYYWVRAVDIQGEESIRNPNSDTSSVQGIAQKITTTSLNDDANFASTANWPDITGTGKPEDNATYNTGALADKDTVATADIDDDSVTIDKIANTLQSTNYAAGSAGWKLTTDGTFEAGNGTFRGALTATSGSIASTVTIGGTAASTVVSGAADGATALQNGDDITDGTIGGVTITSTKLYQGTGTFNNSNTGFYLDSDGKFSLKDKLAFFPSDNTLRVKGNIEADVITVNSNLQVVGDLKASSLAIASITREMFTQDALDEIYGALATAVGGSNGDYKEASGSFTTSGGTVTLALFDHGESDVVVEWLENYGFAQTTDYTGTALQATLIFEASTTSNFATIAASKTETITLGKYDLSAYYGSTYIWYYGPRSVTKTFTTSDLADTTDYYFRVRVTSVGAAFTGITYPFELEANEGVTGVVSTGGNADTLDNLDSTAFLRSNVDDTFDGNLTVTGNLTVNGTTVTLNTATLDVEDKNITLNYGAGDTSASADGAGITIQDAVNSSTDATILWDATNDRFDFSHSIAFDGTATTTNQARGIFWTGYDKEGVTDYSDAASIRHTENTGGHAGSVLVISSQNDATDGIAFSTHASSKLKHNSYQIWTAQDFSNNSSNWDTAYTYSQVGHVPLAGGTMTGNLIFSDSGTGKRGIIGTAGANDQWFIGGAATASNAGYMEISVGDDGTEPIYVRQYNNGTPLTGAVLRTLTLLDSSGNTSLPVSLSTPAIGVNETSRLSPVHITLTASGTALTLQNKLGGTGASVNLDFLTYNDETLASYANPGARISAVDDGNFGGNLTFLGKAGAQNGALSAIMTVNAKGGVQVNSGDLQMGTTSVITASRDLQNVALASNLKYKTTWNGNSLEATEAIHMDAGGGSVLQDSLQFNVAAFTIPVMYAKSGSTWTNIGNQPQLCDGRVAANWGQITLSRSYDEFIFYFGTDLGYTFISAVTLLHSTSGNSMQIYVESSETGGATDTGWTEMASTGSTGSWPGSTTLTFSSGVGGGFNDRFRIRIVPSWDHASNSISLGQIIVRAGYGPVRRLFDWGYDRSIDFVGALKMGGTTFITSDRDITARNIIAKASSDTAVPLRVQRSSASGRMQMTFEDESGSAYWRIGGTASGGDDFTFFSGTANVLVLDRGTSEATFASTVYAPSLQVTKDSYQLRLLRASADGADWRFYSWTGGLNIYPASASTVYFGRDGATTNVSVYNGDLQIGSTSVIDSSRNLVNVGTISSGAITSSGNISGTSGQFGSTSVGGSSTLKVYHTSNFEAATFQTNQGGSLLRFIDPTAQIEIGIQSGKPVIRTGNTARLTVDGANVQINSGALQMGTTTVIDAARNIAAADLTVSGTLSGNFNLSTTQNLTVSGSISGGSLTAFASATPTITLSDIGSTGDGSASGKIIFKNTSGNAIGIGYTGDSTSDSDLIISTNAAGTYGGYLGLDAAGIADAQADIILEPKGNVRIATGSLEMGTVVVMDSSRNMASIGTISSGAITSSGDIQTTGGKLIVKNSGNGFGRIEGPDSNHMIILRGTRDSTTTGADITSYYQYGGTLASGKGHLFYTGGVLASQTLKLGIHNDAINFHQPFYMGGTQVMDTSRNLTSIGTISSGAITSSGNLTIGAGTQTANGDANITIREGNAFAGFDFHSARTSGNIGGLRWFSTSSNSIAEAQLLVEVDGTLKFYNGTNGAQNVFTISSTGALSSGAITSSYGTLGNVRIGHSSLTGSSAYLHNIEATGSYLLIQRNEAVPIEIWGQKIELRKHVYFGVAGSSAATADIDQSGNFNTSGSYRIGGTTVIDSSRNLTNIGTISSGAITSSGAIRSNNWFQGASGTNTLYSDTANGTLLQAPSNTNDAAGSIFMRDGNGVIHFSLNTNTNAASFHGGTISSGAITSSGALTTSTGVIMNTGGDKYWIRWSSGSTTGLYYRQTGGEKLQYLYGGSERWGVDASGNMLLAGVSNAVSGYQVNGTTVIDSSRNLTNIGTVSSTHFTSSANINSTGVGGITVSAGRLGFDQPGTRSWTMGAAAGDLNIYTGDGNGALNLTNNLDLKFNSGIIQNYDSADCGIVHPRENLDGIPMEAGLAYYAFNHNTSTHPSTESDFDTMIRTNVTSLKGTGTWNNASAFTLSADAYLVEFHGYLLVTTAGDYRFGVNADDAVDLYIDGVRVADDYGGHGATGFFNDSSRTSIYLTVGYHKLYARFEEVGGGDSIQLGWNGGSGTTLSAIPSANLYRGRQDVLKNYGGQNYMLGNLVLGQGSSTGVLKLKTYDDAASEWHVYNYNDDTFRLNYNGSGGDEMILTNGGNVTFSGNVTAYSDEKLKSDIQTLDGSKVLQMRGVSFTKDGEAGSGVIAQELEAVAPELVHDGEFKSVAYGNLVGYLIEAVKMQQEQINELKALIKEKDNDDH